MSQPKPLRILLVDDEPDLLHLMSLQFKLRGAHVATVSSGAAALDLLKKSEFDLIISDIQMPDGDGVSFLKNLKALMPNHPVFFFMTGFTYFSRAEAKQMGASEILNKPFDKILVEEYLQKYFPDNTAA